jgi:hypothetical protein
MVRKNVSIDGICSRKFQKVDYFATLIIGALVFVS